MPSKQEAVRKILETHIVFNRLPIEDLNALEEFFEVEKYQAGDVIVERGEAMDGMYCLCGGEVRFKTINESGKRVSLGPQPKDATWGEVSMLQDGQWEFQVSASSQVSLLKLPAAKAKQFLARNPEAQSKVRQQIGLIELHKRLRSILGPAGYDSRMATEILHKIGVKKLARGTKVFEQGADDPRLYYIETGSVELVRDMLEGTVSLEKVGAGGLIGEIAALTGEAHYYTAKVVSDATVLVIRQEEVKKILELNLELKTRLENRVRDLRESEKVEASAIQRAEGVDQRLKIDAITESEFATLKKKKSDIHKFPLVRQQEESECAAACLTMIVRHYGKDFTLGQIRELTNLSMPGPLVQTVCTGGESLGFRAKAYKCDFNTLRQLEMPCIALWENDHYIVIFRATDKTVHIADPARGLLKMSRAEFETGWTDIIVSLIPTQRFEHAEPPKNAYMHFINYLLPFKTLFAEVFLAALIINMLGLATPLFIQNIVDKVVVNNDRSLLNIMLAGMVLVTVFNILTSVVQSLLLAHTTARVDMKMMSEFYRHILSLPMNFFLTRRTGDILTRFGENQKIRRIIAGATITTILNAMMIVVYLLMMFVYNAKLTYIVMVFIPFYIGNTCFFTPRLKKIANDIFLRNSSQQSHLIESLHGIEAVKATANEYYARSRWENSFVDQVNLGYVSAKISLAYGSISKLINLSSTIAILWIGANEVMDGNMTIGSLMGFNMLVGAVMGPIMQMVQLWDSLQEIRISVDRVSDINNVRPEQAPVTDQASLPAIINNLEGRIDFRDIKFRYGGEETPLVLDGFNLTIEPGQTVAFVGPSGCGKSTAAKMVLGFNLPTGGELQIDGKEIRNLDLASFRRQVGVVLQDSFLFSDTVAANIALGDPDPDMVAVREAARLSSADDFIGRLPQSYQTMIGEKGVQVSGGQRQRLCIARALYRRPRILLFDEATSALDNESEAKIQENMKSILAGRSAIVIAHRLTTVLDCDVICFIENGKVVEKGRHDELLALNGRYYEMAKKQFGLE
jgi:ATP-binding cassette subfamily B protein